MTTQNIQIQSEYLSKDGHFHFRTCGLDNVYLKDGFNISEDGFSYSISNIKELHHCIAMYLVNQTSTLAPKELKFLRKELRMTQSELARKVGVDVQTVARWEKGDSETKVADRMIRILYMTSFNSTVNSADVLGFLDTISELDDTSHSQWVFEQSENWKIAA